MNITCKLLPISLAASAFAANTFFFNQAGYDIDKPVSIVVQSTDELEGTKWTLFYAPDDQGMTGASVSDGVFGKGVDPDNWSKSGKYYTITINKKLPYSGQYYLANVSGSPSSSDYFTVTEKALATKTLGMVMDYFYNDRATASAIQSEDIKASIYGSSSTRDVRGGWYDASGDVSKYLSHLSYANYLNPQQIPLTVWSLAFAAEHIPTLLASTPTTATATDEAAYGADFLVRMLDTQGFFYMTVFDGWGTHSRTLCAFSGSSGNMSANYQTAFREGGGMAIAALAKASKLGASGDFTSAQYLDTAEKAYAHLTQMQGIDKKCAYCDDGKENIIDDYTALLAATELYVATQKADYLNDARLRAQHLAGRISDDGYFWSDDAKTRPFWHASDAGLPLIALTRYAEVEAPVSKSDWTCTTSLNGSTCEHPYLASVISAIQKHYNWLISITNKVDNPFGYARQTYITDNEIKEGFFIPHDNESNYWWQGEDARLASLATAAVYAYNALGLKDNENVDKYTTDQLDWILGKNPYGTCMMNGIGKKTPAEYSGSSIYAKTLKGGIANGITGKNTDGSGIAWDDDGVAYVGFSSLEPWNNWRWIEQWLPHTTWFMNALVVRYDEKAEPLDVPAALPKARTVATPAMEVRLQGRTLSINAASNAKVRLLRLDGTEIASTALSSGHTTMNLSNIQSGIYLVKVDGQGARKILLK